MQELQEQLTEYWRESSIRKIQYELERGAYADARSVAETSLWIHSEEIELRNRIIEVFLKKVESLIEQREFSPASKFLDFCSGLSQEDSRIKHFRALIFQENSCHSESVDDGEKSFSLNYKEDESSQILSDSELRVKSHSILKKFIETYLPDEAENFDEYYSMMESVGWLGDFHPTYQAGSHAEIGFLPPAAKDVLSLIVLGVLSNILYDIFKHGLSLQAAIDKNKEESKRIFSQFAKLTQLRNLLEDFFRFMLTTNQSH